jgi:hypothetical protein
MHMGFKLYHKRITWKWPVTGDLIIASQPHCPAHVPISFKPQSLGKLLFDIYLKMFASDDTRSRLSNTLQSLQGSEIIHYIRESFAVFLAIVKWHVNIDWESTMDYFFDQLATDRTLMMGMTNYQDLATHMHLAGVHTFGSMRTPVTKEGRFQGWAQVPPTVSVVLVVPHNKLRVLSDMDPNKVGTPVLHGNLLGRNTHNIFTSLKVGFGKVTSSGTDARPGVVFEPDPASWAGKSSLIVSFSVPSWALHIKHLDSMTVFFGVRSTLSPIASITSPPRWISNPACAFWTLSVVWVACM